MKVLYWKGPEGIQGRVTFRVKEEGNGRCAIKCGHSLVPA